MEIVNKQPFKRFLLKFRLFLGFCPMNWTKNREKQRKKQDYLENKNKVLIFAVSNG